MVSYKPLIFSHIQFKYNYERNPGSKTIGTEKRKGIYNDKIADRENQKKSCLGHDSLLRHPDRRDNGVVFYGSVGLLGVLCPDSALSTGAYPYDTGDAFSFQEYRGSATD